MSGYTADIVQNRGTLAGDVPRLAKPVVPVQLVAKVRDVLDGRA